MDERDFGGRTIRVDDGQMQERRSQEVFRLMTKFHLGKQSDCRLGMLWTNTEKRWEAEHRRGGPTRSMGARGIQGSPRLLKVSEFRSELWMERKILRVEHRIGTQVTF